MKELKDDIQNALEDIRGDLFRYSTKTPEEERFEKLKSEIANSAFKAQTEKDNYDVYDKVENISGDIYPKPSKKNTGELSIINLIYPHLFGGIIGCAVARLLCLNWVGYIILAIIGAFLVGLHKSTYDDKIALRYAVIKNIVIMAIEFICITLVLLVGFINDKM